MHAWRLGALVEEATYGGATDSKASKEAKVRAGSGNSGSEEAQGVPQSQAQLFIPCLNGKFGVDLGVGDGEETGGRRDGSSSLREADEVD